MTPPEWLNTLATRQHLQARILALRDALLQNPSATSALDSWCALHLPPPRHVVTVRKLASGPTEISAGRRHSLDVSIDETVLHRRVQLLYGPVILSEADNWYVPARLTKAMNRRLATSTMAFGRVAMPLAYHRRTVGIEQCWNPLAPGWDPDAPRIEMPRLIFRLHALLLLPDGRPISEVEEHYRPELLGTASGSLTA